MVGGSGFIGQAFALQSVHEGYSVSVLSKTQNQPEHKFREIEYIYADVTLMGKPEPIFNTCPFASFDLRVSNNASTISSIYVKSLKCIPGVTGKCLFFKQAVIT